MKTVKEVSDLTGISIRTLHYYDEIGLLNPTLTNEAGYRFYDDGALEKLQQILYFREFDMPFREIKAIMDNPVLDKKQILESQRLALSQKKKRLERLLSGIDSILKGEKKMDFEVFTRDDVEELFQIFVKNTPKEMLELSIKEFGSMETFHKNYVEKSHALYNRPENNQILFEAYGDKEAVIESARHPMGKEGLETYQQEIDSIMKKFALLKRANMEPDSLEIKMLVCEYALATKKVYGLKNERQLVMGITDTYVAYEKAEEALDNKYEEAGLAKYFVECVREFYK